MRRSVQSETGAQMSRLVLIVLLWLAATFPASASFHALLGAARANDTAMARQLINSGSPVDGASVGHSRSYTPLQWAARYGSAELTRLLLAHGAPVDQRDFNGDRALLWAADEGQVEVIGLLIDAGAAVQTLADPYYKTPLMLAAGGGHANAVRALLSAGADPTSRDQSGGSALHYAAMWGGVDAVRALLEADATDANAIESILYRTPLWYAAMYDNAEMVEALIRGGAWTRPRDSDGRTALLAASLAGRTQAVAALLRLGAQIEERDLDGATPLMLAIISGSADTVAGLKAAGADLAANDPQGRGVEYYLTLVRTSLPTHTVPEGSRAAPFTPDWEAIALDIAQKQTAIKAVLGIE